MFRLVLVVIIALACISCGDSTPTAPDPTPTPEPTPTPSPTACTLQPIDFQAELLTEAPAGFAHQVRIGTLFTETQGMVWSLMNVQLNLMDANGNILEQPELGADDVSAANGDNQVGPLISEPIILDFPFNATGIGRATVVYAFRDTEDRPCNWTLEDIERRVDFP